jgi:uncharacterized membrane protein YphA (DoxX/SURF4 family)
MKPNWTTPETKGQWLALVLRVCMGAWFVYSGGMKVFGSGLDKFVVDIENYQLVNDQMAVVVAYFIPWLEIIAGLCFMLGVLRKGTWLAMLGMVLAFTFSVGSAWARGLNISCGCTGGTEKISYWLKAVEFTGYFAVLGCIAWYDFVKAPARNSQEN